MAVWGSFRGPCVEVARCLQRAGTPHSYVLGARVIFLTLPGFFFPKKPKNPVFSLVEPEDWGLNEPEFVLVHLSKSGELSLGKGVAAA